ncbi:hypothetical protein [Embleya sp. NPDC059213]|uniref:hypothetical protein n=1 Tax=unclassified Embleya TaxID=2699296 RepID=UPI003696D03B
MFERLVVLERLVLFQRFLVLELVVVFEQLVLACDAARRSGPIGSTAAREVTQTRPASSSPIERRRPV